MRFEEVIRTIGYTVLQALNQITILNRIDQLCTQRDVLVFVLVFDDCANVLHFIQIDDADGRFKTRLKYLTEFEHRQFVVWNVL